mgnify:CR=1 FL=1
MPAEMMAEFRGVGQIAANQRVRADNANELAAIHWVTALARAGDDEALERTLLLCGQLDWFWHVHGQHNTARELLDAVLELAKELPPSRGRALAWLAAGMVSITTDDFRKIIGLFAMVQGFEAPRYIGNRFGAEQRISSMRLAQYISSFVFVILVAAILVVFLPPAAEADGTAIFLASDLVGPALPWIVLLAAIGSQTSAILGATSSRSDMIVNTGRVARKWTFPILLIPTIALFLLTDVTQAVALASRVFAFYFLLQALIAGFRAQAAAEG